MVVRVIDDDYYVVVLELIYWVLLHCVAYKHSLALMLVLIVFAEKPRVLLGYHYSMECALREP